METIWKYGNGEYKFDIAEADDLEKFQKAQEELEKAAPELEEYAAKNPARYIRTYCRLLRAFFDDVLEEGASLKIFEGQTDNLRVYKAAETSFLSFVQAQQLATTDTVEKYKPKTRKRK